MLVFFFEWLITVHENMVEVNVSLWQLSQPELNHVKWSVNEYDVNLQEFT